MSNANTEDTMIDMIMIQQTPAPPTFFVLRATRSFTGPLFSVAKGEFRIVRYGYSLPPRPTPKVVTQASAGQCLEWGGCMVNPDFYEITYHGNSVREVFNIVGHL